MSPCLMKYSRSSGAAECGYDHRRSWGNSSRYVSQARRFGFPLYTFSNEKSLDFGGGNDRSGRIKCRLAPPLVYASYGTASACWCVLLPSLIHVLLWPIPEVNTRGTLLVCALVVLEALLILVNQTPANSTEADCLLSWNRNWCSF